MDPVNHSINQDSSRFSCGDRSLLSNVERGCMYLPIPVLCCIGCGGVGFGFSTAFATTVTPVVGATQGLSATAIANIAYDAFAAVGSCFVMGCYIKNLPEKTFEENVKRQLKANHDLENSEAKVNQTIEQFTKENKDLKTVIEEANQKTKRLEKQLDEKSQDLLNLSKELKKTIIELGKTKDNFNLAEKVVADAKNVLITMVEMSQKMKSEIKTSKATLSLFKEVNIEIQDQLNHFDHDNQKLVDLLNHYSKMVVEEHTQFGELIKICDHLNETCQKLEKEVQRLKKSEDRIHEDLKKETENTERLEKVEEELEELVDKLD